MLGVFLFDFASGVYEKSYIRHTATLAPLRSRGSVSGHVSAKIFIFFGIPYLPKRGFKNIAKTLFSLGFSFVVFVLGATGHHFSVGEYKWFHPRGAGMARSFIFRILVRETYRYAFFFCLKRYFFLLFLAETNQGRTPCFPQKPKVR